MRRRAFYRAEREALSDWEPYLLAHSNLPEPRGDLELAYAVTNPGSKEQFLRWPGITASDAHKPA